MKIFIVQSHLGGGGAERVGCMLANGFAARNHETFMVTDLFEDQPYSVGEDVAKLNLMSPYKGKMKKWGSALLNLRRLVKQYQPDVVIGIMQMCSLIARIACLGTRTHVIMTEHDSFERPESAPMSRVDTFCKFYLNKIYECVTVITQADKEYIGNRLKNVEVMPNPLLLQPITSAPSKSNVVLAVGRLDAWHYKGFDVLIKAWGRVVKREARKVKSEGWRLQIAGAGSEQSLAYLKQLCRENGVEDMVDFLGFQNDVENLYKKASIFVLSSRYEGFGLVLIEAMSQGCACIACDYKGRQREIMKPASPLTPLQMARGIMETTKGNTEIDVCETGILCEPDNVEALATALERMIIDDEYRGAIRELAVERSEYYNIDHTMTHWEQLLSQTLNQ